MRYANMIRKALQITLAVIALIVGLTFILSFLFPFQLYHSEFPPEDTGAVNLPRGWALLAIVYPDDTPPLHYEDRARITVCQGTLDVYQRQTPNPEPRVDQSFGFRWLAYYPHVYVSTIFAAPHFFWGIHLSLGFLFALLGLYPTVAFVRGPLRRRSRSARGRCINCGYDLTGNFSGVCPECGTQA